MRNKLQFCVILLLLLVAGLSHGINMFGFPYYENDEGVYLSQAYSLIHFGKLAPYTYWYDHAPMGWMLIGLWLAITKSIYLFGFALNSGRVLMLLAHLASTYLVIRISRRLSGSLWPGVFAAIIFSLSPLGIYFQRRLLLDNLMIFWVLLSYFLAIHPSRRLGTIFASGLAFGLAVLTKETAVVFLPGFILALFKTLPSQNKKFALVGWAAIVFSLVSLYVLYAALKGELFPSGTFFGGSAPHVSLLETLKYQASRKSVSSFDFQNGTFWVYLRLWLKQDPFIIGLGIVSQLYLSIYSFIKRNWYYFSLCLFELFFWIFLMRGGVVIEFYILPLLPLLALTIGLSIDVLIRNKAAILSLLLIFTAGFYLLTGSVSRAFPQYNSQLNIYTSKQTRGQIEAVNWIKKYLPSDSKIVIDNYAYLDLHIPKNYSDPVFPNAHWYWKVDQDPQIKSEVFLNSSEQINYVAQTPQMRVDLMQGISLLTSDAISNSRLSNTFITDGWGVDLFMTRFPSGILSRSWSSYQKTFMEAGEKVVDASREGITTSEGQSYALLRAVWQNDQPAFDRVWNWTKNNLQGPAGTFAWKWGTDSAGVQKVLDAGSAADADTDIALALLFASKQWPGQDYLAQAQKVLSGIWDTEVRSFAGSYYLVPGNWAKNKSLLVINPSYLSPYAYRIFAAADPAHPWQDLISSSYHLLEGCTLARLEKPASGGLPPDWCGMDAAGNFSQISESGLTSTNYSFDALRVNWRIALDYLWFSEPRAQEYLAGPGKFFASLWDAKKHIPLAYSHDGIPWNPQDSVLGYASVLANFTVTNPDAALDVYQEKMLVNFHEDVSAGTSFWEDPANYYLQNWAWFSTALYSNHLPNLWSSR